MLDLVTEHPCETAESLSQSHRHGILKLGASHLDDVLEFLGLGGEGVHKRCEMRLEALHLDIETYVDGGRISVVGGLRTVHMVVGRAVLVLAALVAHDFQRTVGDDLVGVHVGRSAGASLYHVYGEMLEVLAVHYLAACLREGDELFVGQQAELMVRHGGTELGDCQTFDECRIVREMKFADFKILYASHCLYAVQCTFRHLLGADKVGLRAESLFTVLVHI